MNSTTQTRRSSCPAATASIPTTTLLDLPPEVQLRILSSLPAREIQKCRRVNTHLRELIDAPGNHALSIGPSVKMSLQRFDDSIKNFCFYPIDTFAKDGMPTALLKAFAYFVGNTIRLDHDEDFQDEEDENEKEEFPLVPFELFVQYWNCRAYPGAARLKGRVLIDAQWTVVRVFITALLKWNPQPLTELERAGWQGLLAHNPAPLHVHPFFGAATEEQFAKVFAAAENNSLEGEKIFSFTLVPKVLRLVDRPTTTDAAEMISKYSRKCHSTIGCLIDLLQIPDLPYKAPVTYCFTSRWAWVEVKAALHDHEDIGPIKRAAILEEMVIR